MHLGDCSATYTVALRYRGCVSETTMRFWTLTRKTVDYQNHCFPCWISKVPCSIIDWLTLATTGIGLHGGIDELRKHLCRRGWIERVHRLNGWRCIRGRRWSIWQHLTQIMTRYYWTRTWSLLLFLDNDTSCTGLKRGGRIIQSVSK